MASIAPSNWFCNQNLGIFQNTLPALISAIDRVDINTRTHIRHYMVLDKNEDPPFPAFGAFKKIYFCIAKTLAAREFTVHVAARSDLNCPWFSKEKRVLSVLNGTKGALQPLLIEAQGAFEYMISDLFNQGELFTVIENRSINLSGYHAHMLAYSIVSAVLECHAKGVVLRDVKPDNFLVKLNNGSYESVVIDFGMAFLMEEDSKEEATRACGSPEYVSNEDWAEVRKTGKCLPADYSRDAWALGTVLFALTTALLPGDLVKCTKTGQILGISFHDSNSFNLGVFSREIRALVYNPRHQVPPLEMVQRNMRNILLRTYPSVQNVQALQPANAAPQRLPKWKTEEDFLAFMKLAASTKTSSGETILDRILSFREKLRISLAEIDQNIVF